MNGLLFISVILSTVLAATHALLPPTRAAPKSVVHRLLGPAMSNGLTTASTMSRVHPHVARMLLPDKLRAVSRQPGAGRGDSFNDAMMMESIPEPSSFPGDHDYFGDDEFDDYYYHSCPDKDRNGHVMTLAMDYYGPRNEAFYADRRNHFLRLAFGQSPEDIVLMQDIVLQYFQLQFGLHFNGTVYNRKTGLYYDPVSKLVGGPVIFSESFRMVANSHHDVHCTDTKAVIGGWILSGKDVMVKGELHPKGQLYRGETMFVFAFMVLNVGTPYSDRFILGFTYPLHCPENGACAVSGIVANTEDFSIGWFDGVAVHYEMPGRQYTLVKRMTMMSPGRFTPGLTLPLQL